MRPYFFNCPLAYSQSNIFRIYQNIEKKCPQLFNLIISEQFGYVLTGNPKLNLITQLQVSTC